MRHVEFTGQHPFVRAGAKALMRDDGKVQLDGPKDMWRAASSLNVFCHGWHDLGTEWKDL